MHGSKLEVIESLVDHRKPDPEYLLDTLVLIADKGWMGARYSLNLTQTALRLRITSLADHLNLPLWEAPYSQYGRITQEALDFVKWYKSLPRAAGVCYTPD